MTEKTKNNVNPILQVTLRANFPVKTDKDASHSLTEYAREQAEKIKEAFPEGEEEEVLSIRLMSADGENVIVEY